MLRAVPTSALPFESVTAVVSLTLPALAVGKFSAADFRRYQLAAADRSLVTAPKPG